MSDEKAPAADNTNSGFLDRLQKNIAAKQTDPNRGLLDRLYKNVEFAAAAEGAKASGILFSDGNATSLPSVLPVKTKLTSPER